MRIDVKRIYEPYSPKDGFRILVDRLWLRGLTKEKAKVDLWMKEIAPSSELRHWYHSNRSEKETFEKRYFQELKQKRPLLEQLKQHTQKQSVTLLYASKNNEFNNATVLKKFLETY